MDVLHLLPGVSVRQMSLPLFALLTFVSLTCAEMFLNQAAINAFLDVHNQLREETAVCADSRLACVGWARRGECERNKGWMRRHCRLSCGQCPCEPGCQNKYRTCRFWANRGECDVNQGWMSRNCPLSCGKCPCGAGMPHLVWSRTLARHAAVRVNKCVYQHDPAKTYGENLYMTTGTFQDAAQAAVAASRAWGDEIAFVGAPGADYWACSFTKKDETTCAHYTQQVWNTTTRVGCAVSYCPQFHYAPYAFTYVVCEYEPRGNGALYDSSTGHTVHFPPY